MMNRVKAINAVTNKLRMHIFKSHFGNGDRAGTKDESLLNWERRRRTAITMNELNWTLYP